MRRKWTVIKLIYGKGGDNLRVEKFFREYRMSDGGFECKPKSRKPTGSFCQKHGRQAVKAFLKSEE